MDANARNPPANTRSVRAFPACRDQFQGFSSTRSIRSGGAASGAAPRSCDADVAGPSLSLGWGVSPSSFGGSESRAANGKRPGTPWLGGAGPSGRGTRCSAREREHGRDSRGRRPHLRCRDSGRPAAAGSHPLGCLTHLCDGTGLRRFRLQQRLTTRGRTGRVPASSTAAARPSSRSRRPADVIGSGWSGAPSREGTLCDVRTNPAHDGPPTPRTTPATPAPPTTPPTTE